MVNHIVFLVEVANTCIVALVLLHPFDPFLREREPTHALVIVKSDVDLVSCLVKVGLVDCGPTVIQR